MRFRLLHFALFTLIVGAIGGGVLSRVVEKQRDIEALEWLGESGAKFHVADGSFDRFSCEDVDVIDLGSVRIEENNWSQKLRQFTGLKELYLNQRELTPESFPRISDSIVGEAIIAANEKLLLSTEISSNQMRLKNFCDFVSRSTKVRLSMDAMIADDLMVGPFDNCSVATALENISVAHNFDLDHQQSGIVLTRHEQE